MTPQEAWEKRYAPRKWADAAQGLQNIWLGAWTIASAMHIEAERERCAKLLTMRNTPNAEVTGVPASSARPVGCVVVRQKVSENE